MIVVGVGNALRGDDAAGLHAAARLRGTPGARVLTHEGESLGLLELWQGAGAVILVDAVRSGAPAGSLRRLDAGAAPLPATWRSSSSTHAVSLAEVIELARILGRLPPRVLVHGVEGRGFELGAPLSEEVATAIGPLADAVARDVATALR